MSGVNDTPSAATDNLRMCARCRVPKPNGRIGFPIIRATGELTDVCRDCTYGSKQKQKAMYRAKYATISPYADGPPTKICSQCEQEFPRTPENFAIRAYMKGGLFSYCVRCTTDRTRARRLRYPLRGTYQHLIERCYNEDHVSYPWYGAKGITVCDLWRESYFAFQEWALAAGWKKGLEIDRIDSTGPYTPENCRILTKAENRRRSSHTQLTAELVATVKTIRRDTGASAAKISRQLGIPEHFRAIGHVLADHTWRDVLPDSDPDPDPNAADPPA